MSVMHAFFCDRSSARIAFNLIDASFMFNYVQIVSEVNTVLEKVNSSCTDLNSLNFFLETNDEDSPSAPIASKIKDVLVKVLSAVSDSQVSVDTNASLNDIVACLNDNGLNVEENASSGTLLINESIFRKNVRCFLVCLL